MICEGKKKKGSVFVVFVDGDVCVMVFGVMCGWLSNSLVVARVAIFLKVDAGESVK